MPPHYTVPHGGQLEQSHQKLLPSPFPPQILRRHIKEFKLTQVQEAKRADNKMPKFSQTLLVPSPLKTKGCLQRSLRACEVHCYSSETFCEFTILQQYKNLFSPHPHTICLSFSLYAVTRVLNFQTAPFLHTHTHTPLCEGRAYLVQ